MTQEISPGIDDECELCGDDDVPTKAMIIPGSTSKFAVGACMTCRRAIQDGDIEWLAEHVATVGE
jgi:hypothetical protein